MTIEFILGLQILADIALCLVIIFLIRATNRKTKKSPSAIDAESFSEFRKLIEDSRVSTDCLFQALNEVKEIGYVLDEKEKRLRTLIKETAVEPDDRKSENSTRKKKYEDVIKMAEQGLTEKEIADTLNLAEGETSLILNLHRKKNENSAPSNNIS
ncbi:MAG: DUF2802 domain-containing protein [Desulfobacterales bacterium]|nr:DUF2802 domain-containing protein [Desulfobacterales bacterium]MBU8910538.1 DUF2802 domain-containing protein [Desulfobacterales bacterium]